MGHRARTLTFAQLLSGALAIALASGCSSTSRTAVRPAGPDYSRQLRPGESPLRLVTDPARMPDLAEAYDRYRQYDQFLLEAMDESLLWFTKPSTRQFFPYDNLEDGRSITHAHAEASVLALRDVFQQSRSREAFLAEFERLFDVYESVGYNNEGIVLFTGYYTPIFRASRTRRGAFQHPLYRRPGDLITDPVTGEPRGRETPNGQVVPYYTRSEIESSRMFAGNELVWLESALDAYIIHVNGSAKLRLRDGSVACVGYAGKTDRPYTGLGRSMLDEGLLGKNELSLRAIKAHYHRDPATIERLIERNENYVFFTEYDESIWPAGSLGVRVTEETTLATDKKVYPRAGVVLVDTSAINVSGRQREFLRFMLDQDTGGAIKAPGRADIFMGKGPTAEILAGGQYAEGRLYYIFLKPEYVDEFRTDRRRDEFAGR